MSTQHIGIGSVLVRSAAYSDEANVMIGLGRSSVLHVTTQPDKIMGRYVKVQIRMGRETRKTARSKPETSWTWLANAWLDLWTGELLPPEFEPERTS